MNTFKIDRETLNQRQKNSIRYLQDAGLSRQEIAHRTGSSLNMVNQVCSARVDCALKPEASEALVSLCASYGRMEPLESHIPPGLVLVRYPEGYEPDESLLDDFQRLISDASKATDQLVAGDGPGAHMLSLSIPRRAIEFVIQVRHLSEGASAFGGDGYDESLNHAAPAVLEGIG